MKKRFSLPISCSWLLLLMIGLNICEILCVGVWYYWLDSDARSAMAEELGIKPDWESLAVYIELNFKPGMTRLEILKEAEKIGAYSIKPFFLGNEYCEAFYFNIGPFFLSRGGRWHICYDDNFTVVSVEEFRHQ